MLLEYQAKRFDVDVWASSNVYFMTAAYNTPNVRAADVPQSYADLLHPRWKGQILWSTSRGSGGPQFIGHILLTMGQEAGKPYLQKLKMQNIAKSTASARQVIPARQRSQTRRRTIQARQLHHPGSDA